MSVATQTMTVLLQHGLRDVRVAERPRPEPKPGEVLLKIHAVTVCASDLHVYAEGNVGGVSWDRPFVPGHEASGVVEDSNGTWLTPGTPVVIDPADPLPELPSVRRRPLPPLPQHQVLRSAAGGWSHAAVPGLAGLPGLPGAVPPRPNRRPAHRAAVRRSPCDGTLLRSRGSDGGGHRLWRGRACSRSRWPNSEVRRPCTPPTRYRSGSRWPNAWGRSRCPKTSRWTSPSRRPVPRRPFSGAWR